MLNRKEYMEKWNRDNKENIQKYLLKWRKNNKIKIKDYTKNWKKETPNYMENYYINNKEKIKQKNKIKYDSTKIYINKICPICNKIFETNKKHQIYCSLECFKIKRTERNIKYHKNRRKIDPLYKFEQNIRSLIYKSYTRKNYKKSLRTEQIIGCTIPFLINHIEKQFYDRPETREKMTWENNNIHGWHVDHDKQLFHGQTEEDILKLNHYSNLRPMWCEKNWSREKKLILVERRKQV